MNKQLRGLAFTIAGLALGFFLVVGITSTYQKQTAVHVSAAAEATNQHNGYMMACDPKKNQTKLCECTYTKLLDIKAFDSIDTYMTNDGVLTPAGLDIVKQCVDQS